MYFSGKCRNCMEATSGSLFNRNHYNEQESTENFYSSFLEGLTKSVNSLTPSLIQISIPFL